MNYNDEKMAIFNMWFCMYAEGLCNAASDPTGRPGEL